MIVREILINSFRILKKNSLLTRFNFAYSTIKSFKSAQDEKDINIIVNCEYKAENLSSQLIGKNSRKIKEESQIMLLESQVEFQRKLNNDFNSNLFSAKDNLNKTLEVYDKYFYENKALREYFAKGKFTKATNAEIEEELQNKREKVKTLEARQAQIEDIFQAANA